MRSDLKPEGVRSFVVPEFQNYLLFYQIKGDQLLLLRLKFGGMGLPGLFRGVIVSQPRPRPLFRLL